MTGEGHVQVNINTAQFASGKGGSIPTCAGQPSSTGATGAPTTVYPHVCGAASLTIDHPATRCGLSPRVRGSRLKMTAKISQQRSIPTCAGQPRLC